MPSTREQRSLWVYSGNVHRRFLRSSFISHAGRYIVEIWDEVAAPLDLHVDIGPCIIALDFEAYEIVCTTNE
jgi:hypothetical protein